MNTQQTIEIWLDETSEGPDNARWIVSAEDECSTTLATFATEAEAEAYVIRAAKALVSSGIDVPDAQYAIAAIGELVRDGYLGSAAEAFVAGGAR